MANVALHATPPTPTRTTSTTSNISPLTAAEIAALALSLAHLGTGPQAAVARRALSRLLDAEPDEPFAAHAPRDLAADSGDTRTGSDELIAVTLATLTTPLDGDTAERAKVLAAGISERLAVRLHYSDAKGTHSVRYVEPVTCLVHRDHWYLVGWCRLRRGIRAFRFDRVLAVEPTSSPARAHLAERFLPFQRRAAA
ncbi:helix-turn-helix transcriptional regulator [Actinomadura sp. HBU206391]|uniref:helix-turn-helix transcriptional regulator n=1 Tax=Actinomadura sp. HBU206391 TaxID=2731692 RepID=UPI00164FD5E5|nr:WYL domain-containing protein [Actinomadura sp. HBU206391]MBC6460011.1 WYL domain-containing protein [Actinomadura sp. HBU206391]